MENIDNKDEEKINLYLEYCENYSEYYNAFELLNVGENSISQLLAWLLDVDWTNEIEHNIPENEIHSIFCYEFLKLVKNKEIEENSNKTKSVLQEYDDKDLKELASGIVAMQDVNQMDILLVNNKKEFVCVIENKKRAKLSNSKIKDSEKRILQIEKYHQIITDEEKYKKYNKKFVYLCAEEGDTNVSIEEKLSDIGKVPKDIQDNLIYKGEKTYNDIKNIEVSDLLKDCDYTIIEHDKVVLILYEILFNKYQKYDIFDYGAIKPLSNDDMKKLAIELLEFFSKRYTIEKSIPGNSKMRFYDKLSNKFKEEQRIMLLCQYIEYWELHNDERCLGDNLYGYTKIVNGEYIWDVFKRIYKTNSKKWEEIKDKAKEIKSKQLNNILDNIPKIKE